MVDPETLKEYQKSILDFNAAMSKMAEISATRFADGTITEGDIREVFEKMSLRYLQMSESIGRISAAMEADRVLH